MSKKTFVPSIYDIAKQAGVSHMTVSRVINGYPGVATETVNKVKQIIAANNFLPNIIAKGLGKGQTFIIGVFLPWGKNFFLDPFITEIFKGITESSMLYGYSLVMFFPQKLEAIWEKIKLTDGAIVISNCVSDKVKGFLLDSELPIVSVNRLWEGKNVYNVIVRSENGAYEAITYLLQLGHQRIGIIIATNENGTEKLRGYEKAFKIAGLNIYTSLIKQINVHNFNEINNALNELLKQKISAVFCHSDSIADIIIELLKGKNFKIPEDISVVGFDDTEESARHNLTTVRIPVLEMGKESVRILVDRIEGKSVLKTVYYDSELKIRGTSGNLSSFHKS